ncbi:hypothetical protein C4565_08560 [Candidatus Parcubacteria bacterium]|jgi:hypothetical protein|nr:MAG: hypothetical protein C4565_08560 [Candidatus Parcubacteria bacterium]
MKIGYIVHIDDDATYVYLPGEDDLPIKKIKNSGKSFLDKIEDVKTFLKEERGVKYIDEPKITSKRKIEIFGSII